MWKIFQLAILAVALFVASDVWASPTLKTLVSFEGTNGAGPSAGLLIDTANNLYGTTLLGGDSFSGTVFEIPAGTNTISTLATFNKDNGSSPTAGLIADASGNLYGTTMRGGAAGLGTVFEVAAKSSTVTTLATFNGTNGEFPEGPLYADAVGNLYGTTRGFTSSSPAYDVFGTVFEIPAGTQTLSTLVTFGLTNGTGSSAGLIADAAGNLYGTTAYSWGGYGSIFKVAAGTHVYSTVAAFDGSNGGGSLGALIVDAAGNLYGISQGQGSDSSVFEVAAGTNTISTIARFNGANGLIPVAGLIDDAAGNLYGMTNAGGASNYGTVFKVAVGSGTITTLESLNPLTGDYPYGSLIADANGNLYGTTQEGGGGGGGASGTVFELSNTGFVVPEPASLSLLVLAGSAILPRRRRIIS